MFDVTEILLAVIALLSAVVTGVVIPWVRAKTTFAQHQKLTAWVSIAVQAAEQLYKGSGRGQEKKEYVVSWLNERGITFDEETVDAAIEAAVYGLVK